VQFVDGDCTLADGWLEHAVETLERQSDVAVVCGRRREIAPNASIYNLLCDVEWDTPIGDASSCGGDALMRIDALEQVGGFNPAVVAGEEPELCFRLRERGWRIQRIDQTMTYHDAGMTRFGEWWRRAVRGGHAIGQGVALHGCSRERFCVRSALSIWGWTFGPLVAVGATMPVVGHAGLLVLAIYPLQVTRIAVRQRRQGRSWHTSLAYGVGCVIDKWARLQGQLQWWWRWLRGREPTLIEYKGNEDYRLI
jgi:hypothetical protein